MIKDKNYREGQMLRIERLRQGKGIKEVANNICSISTLSKIERGKQEIDPNMLVALYKELGINYEADKTFVESMKNSIQQYFYETIYQFERKSLSLLKLQDKRLSYGPLALEWMVIKAMEDDKDILNILDECVEYMDEELLAWYYLIPRYESKEIAVGKRIKAQRILQNSYSTLALMWEYWSIGEHSKAINLSSIAVNYALDEGNTWALSQVYIILGSIYACYDMEELMIKEYLKVINLLKNTNWKDRLGNVYYNIGATYISLGNYEKAREYLGQCNYDSFYVRHKWAVLEIRTGNLAEANHWIEKMEEYIEEYRAKNILVENVNGRDVLDYEEKNKVLEITKLQVGGNPESTPNYVPLLESLMKKFYNEGRYGFMNFHKNSLKGAYISKRRYKDAMELEELFSSIRTKHMVNIQK